MRVEESIRIAAPREEVWPFISQPGCYSQFMVNSTWSPVEGEPTSGLRARWNTEIGVGSINLSSLVEFVEWDPPHEIAWVNITGIDQRGRWILRDCHPHTEATLRVSFQAPGGVLALVASQLGKPLIHRDLRRSLEALREAVRKGPIDDVAAA
ncbi:MAG TPA: SRPBCC family protein [Solirubrobacterales bacterium]|nr:SRPBCC family protein [Solirubrobacterales bacterium]